jgi:hypothetical protein
MPLDNAQVKFVLQAAQTIAIGINQVISLFSPTRFSASVPPTCPAPRMIIFISVTHYSTFD